MIEQGIKSGKKFTVEDMQEMQYDVQDVHARYMLKDLIEAARSVKSELSPEY